MRTIVKTTEPPCVAEARRSGVADFDDALGGASKQGVREALVAEQRGICCYCGGRIKATAETMKVEHLVPQSDPERGHELRLVWTNLFGACLGGEGAPRREQHCDTRKGDRRSPLTPLDPHLADRLKYLGDGRVESDAPGLADSLHDVLGLNVAKLVNNREAVIQRLGSAAGKAPGTRTAAWFHKQLARLTGPDTRELDAYVQVIEYWLRKHAARSA